MVVSGLGPIAEIHETDDRGRDVALSRPAHRIVSLAPMVTEL